MDSPTVNPYSNVQTEFPDGKQFKFFVKKKEKKQILQTTIKHIMIIYFFIFFSLLERPTGNEFNPDPSKSDY